MDDSDVIIQSRLGLIDIDAVVEAWEKVFKNVKNINRYNPKFILQLERFSLRREHIVIH